MMRGFGISTSGVWWPVVLTPEFWCRYASYLSPSSSDEAVAVLDRGLSFLKHAPDLLLLKAALLGGYGCDVDGARLVHESLTEHSAPGLLEAVLAHARV